MREQDYRIHFLNGHMITVREEQSGPADNMLHNRFLNSKPDAILVVGTKETSRAFIPVRNILYISTDGEEP